MEKKWQVFVFFQKSTLILPWTIRKTFVRILDSIRHGFHNENCWENGNENISPEMEKALQYGVEYGKYFIVAAYLHDIKTPGWGDAYMKAKREKQGYSPATFSEDKELEKDIFRMVFDETSQFYRILEFHGIDKQLLATMVQSMASESDICLGGLLLKDKRKFTEEQLADPELPYAFYPKGSGYDADQMSGTETNMEWLISRFLPGGYILKKDLLDDRKPIGSFEERVRLLSFMLATGMTKDDMTEACRRIGIDPKRMFISSEEIGLGYNLALAEVELEHENKKILEIMVVATRPSDIKKAKLIFNVAQEGFYRSKTRAPVEALVQVLIERGQFGPGAQINESTFRNRTDTEVRDELNRVAPIIPWIFDTFRTNATIITAEDLQNLPETIIKNCLLLETSMADLIQFKEGTMVMTSDSYEDNFKNSRRIILPWMEVLKFKYQQLAVNEREPKITDNDLSLPKRLINAKKQLEQIKVYMLIPINVDQQIRMRQLVRSCPQTEGAMMEGFRDWKKVVDLPNKTLIPDMEVFYKDHYHT